jgi:hypothetical protein
MSYMVNNVVSAFLVSRSTEPKIRGNPQQSVAAVELELSQPQSIFEQEKTEITEPATFAVKIRIGKARQGLPRTGGRAILFGHGLFS